MAKYLLFFTFFVTIIGVSRALSHDEALRRLKAEGISIFSSRNCFDRNNGRCTSLEAIREQTISGVITLKKAAPTCPIVITGGTEVGHSNKVLQSHYNGYKVDIRKNDCINNYIQTRFEYVGRRAGDNAKKYRAASGNIYADEGNHWDIVFY